MSAQSSAPKGPSPTNAGELRVQRIGRYALYGDFAAGGMATVHFGRLIGPVGFSRTVAIKRLHPQFARDDEFVGMLVDEARLAARVQHPNVVQTLDVIQTETELFLVMDYVHGESLAVLLRKALAAGVKMPAPVAAGVMHQALFGLHAAHEAHNEQGEPLELVHRDLSPHNVLVGIDGVARVLDFGIAKAGGRSQITRDGQVKGKLSYFPPEQLSHDRTLDRRADVYAAAASLWEALAGRRLIQGDNDFQRMSAICAGEVPPPSRFAEVSPAVDAVVLKGLAREPEDRFATAREMALALEAAITPASPRAIGEWVEAVAGDALRARGEQLATIERHSASVTSSSGEEGTSHGRLSYRPAAAPSGRWSVPPGGAQEALEDEALFAPPRRRRKAWLAAFALLLIGGGAFGAAGYAKYAREGAGPSTRSALAAAPRTPEPVAHTAEPPPAVDSQVNAAPVTPSAPVVALAQPPSSTPRAHHGLPSHATPAADPEPAAPAPPPSLVSKPAPAAAAPAANADCEVPYTVDAQGIRHPKLECL